MDAMIQSYMEETEDMLQKAEECIIRLEMEYSSVDVNELFRIAHTIKGSSHMVGYEDIGNLMHKIEDMLDCARNGSILFDQSIVSLCFEGLDTVKKMLQYKKEPGSQELMASLVNAASRINEMVEVFIRVNKKDEKKVVVEQPGTGIVSSLLNKKHKGKNKYYITFFIEKDAPMVSPVLIMILKSVEDIGTLVYSSVSDNYFSGCSVDNEIKTFDIIISTDIDEVELYTYFALFYVERINVVDLTRSKLQENDFCFSNADDVSYVIILKAFLKLYNLYFMQCKRFEITKEELAIIKDLHCEVNRAFGRIQNNKRISAFIQDFNELYMLIIKSHDRHLDMDEGLCSNIQTQIAKLTERAYAYTRGKHLFRTFKLEKDGFINRLKTFVDLINKSSTLIIFIDTSELSILHENEIKELIEIKRQLEAQEVEIGIIADGPHTRRIMNILDSIKPIEEFKVYETELDAVLRMFHSEDCFHKLSKVVKEVYHE